MIFNVKVYKELDGILTLKLEAFNREVAIQKAESEGFSVISAHTSSTFQLKMSRHFPLVLFTQELLSLLEAGMPLLGTIEALARKEKRPETQKIYNELGALLKEGKPFSAALEAFPETFPPLYVALVTASERTGDMPQSFRRYLTYKENVDKIRRKISTAAIYPSILMVVGTLVVIFLMTYVVPRLSVAYEDMGSNLPVMSKLMLEMGLFIKINWMLFLMAFICTFALFGYGLTRTSVRKQLSIWILSLPLIGERIRLYELSRFYRTLGLLLEGGIHIKKALSMTAGLFNHQNLKSGLSHATQDISEGKSISESMHRNGLSSEVSYQMINIGERSGNLGEMMERISRFYDDDISRSMDLFIKLFEPLLMLLIGLIIGAIILLMYMPILDLAGSIQ